MRILAQLLTALVGLGSLALGAMALFAPEQAAETLGFGQPGAKGLNSVRADVGGFFLAAAVACAGGLAGRPGWLYGAALLYGLAAVGRLTGVVMAGLPPDVAPAIVLELVIVAVLVWCARVLRRN